MLINQLNLLLADDDTDDCIFFQEALEELPVAVNLATVNDGVQLMNLLSKKQESLPDLLFLDLNMPRKTGMECLSEIKRNEKLRHLPVIIFSTSINMEVMNELFNKGASHYIRKPAEFSKLKKVIGDAITISSKNNPLKPSRENFLIQA